MGLVPGEMTVTFVSQIENPLTSIRKIMTMQVSTWFEIHRQKMRFFG